MTATAEGIRLAAETTFPCRQTRRIRSQDKGAALWLAPSLVLVSRKRSVYAMPPVAAGRGTSWWTDWFKQP